MNHSGRLLYPAPGTVPQAPLLPTGVPTEAAPTTTQTSNGSLSSILSRKSPRSPRSPKSERRVSFARVAGTATYHVDDEPPELLTQDSLWKLNPISVDEAIFEAGVGRTQYKLLLICGLAFCSDAAEVTFLSYVTEVLRCDWGLTSYEESLITSAVFAGMVVGAPVWG